MAARLTALVLWVVAFLLIIATCILTNDHFDRISRARQVARYGDLPFRDFFDPGYFMSVLASAALQRLLGDRLLGEVLLDASFIATGTVIVLLLVRRASGSLLVGAGASILALLTLPRLYDFDKFLFYPLGVLACWRYVERRSTRDLVVLGATLVAGAVFRYDTGVYIGAAALVTLIVVHWGEWRVLARRLAGLTATVACAALPFLVFVQLNGGLANAADQVVTYARREAARTRISSAPRFSFGRLATVERPPPPSHGVRVRWAASVDEAERRALAARYTLRNERPHGDPENRTWAYQLEDVTTGNVRALLADPRVEDTAGIDRARSAVPEEPAWTRLERTVPLLRVRILPGSWGDANGAAFLYFLLWGLPMAGAIAAWAGASEDARSDRARILGVATMCLALDVFVLRDPVGARVGGIAGPATILGASIAIGAWRGRRLAARTGVVIAVAVTVWAVAVVADWNTHLNTRRSWARRLSDNARLISTSPTALHNLPNPELRGVVAYLRECTGPEDRVYASWFVPELYFYAQRGFAAGMPVTFGGHWSAPRFVNRMVAIFAAQSVPIVIIDRRSYKEFQDYYRAFDVYLQAHYHAGDGRDSSTWDAGSGPYRVLVRNDRPSTGTHAASSMACFR